MPHHFEKHCKADEDDNGIARPVKQKIGSVTSIAQNKFNCGGKRLQSKVRKENWIFAVGSLDEQLQRGKSQGGNRQPPQNRPQALQGKHRAASIPVMRAAFKLLTQDGLMGDAAIRIWVASRRRTAAIGVYQNGTRAQQQTHKQQDSNSTFCHCGISSCRKLAWRLPNTRQSSACA